MGICEKWVSEKLTVYPTICSLFCPWDHPHPGHRSVQLTIDTPNFQFLMVIRLSISTEVEFQVMVKITQLKQSQDKNCLSYLHKVKVDS